MDSLDGATITLSATPNHEAEGAYLCGALAPWSEVSATPPAPGFDNLRSERVVCDDFGQFVTIAISAGESQITIRQFYVYGSFGCVPCPVNSYASSAGSQACTPCPSASVTSGTGATDMSQCVPCTLGQVVVGDVCVPCEANTYAADGECVPCLENMFSDAGTAECVFRCPRGSFFDSDSGDCVTCPAGSYAHAGSTECAMCEPGWSPSVSAPACADDPAVEGAWAGCAQVLGWAGDDCDFDLAAWGWAADTPVRQLCPDSCGDCGTPEPSICEACVPGQFDDDRVQDTPCIPCPAGRFNSSAGVFAVEGAAATSDTCSECAPGEFAAEGSAECQACPYGKSDHDSDPATPCETCAAGKARGLTHYRASMGAAFCQP